MVNGFEYVDDMLNRIYRPLMNAQLRADVIDPAADLDPYRLVVSAFLPALDEAGLRERLRAWIEAGGTWVVGPFTDVRTLDSAKPAKSPFGSLEEWTGAYCKYEIPGEPRDFELRWSNGTFSKGSLWYAGFEPSRAKALATYNDGPLGGLAAVTETRLGKGRIVVLGTLPPPADLEQFMLRLAAQCAVLPAAEATPNVLVVPREGEIGRGLIVVELENRPGTLKLHSPATDVLSGTNYAGEFSVRPYQVMVLVDVPSDLRSLGPSEKEIPGARLQSTT
jgi:beta-galactosidase GanA